jgi:hypothetical protein
MVRIDIQRMFVFTKRKKDQSNTPALFLYVDQLGCIFCFNELDEL